MFERPSMDLQSLLERRRRIWRLYAIGELDEDEATLRLLRVDVDSGRSGLRARGVAGEAAVDYMHSSYRQA